MFEIANGNIFSLFFPFFICDDMRHIHEFLFYFLSFELHYASRTSILFYFLYENAFKSQYAEQKYSSLLHRLQTKLLKIIVFSSELIFSSKFQLDFCSLHEYLPSQFQFIPFPCFSSILIGWLFLFRISL